MSKQQAARLRNRNFGDFEEELGMDAEGTGGFDCWLGGFGGLLTSGRGAAQVGFISYCK
jgi:hypothetical protein